MIVVDEYIAVRVVQGRWPEPLPDSDELLLPLSRHWRLLQALHAERGGQLSRLLDNLSPTGRDGIRFPHPEVLRVADPRTLLDEAARVSARYGSTGWLIAETLVLGAANGLSLWFGRDRNVGRVLARAAEELGIEIQVTH